MAHVKAFHGSNYIASIHSSSGDLSNTWQAASSLRRHVCWWWWTTWPKGSLEELASGIWRRSSRGRNNCWNLGHVTSTRRIYNIGEL